MCIVSLKHLLLIFQIGFGSWTDGLMIDGFLLTDIVKDIENWIHWFVVFIRGLYRGKWSVDCLGSESMLRCILWLPHVSLYVGGWLHKFYPKFLIRLVFIHLFVNRWIWFNQSAFLSVYLSGSPPLSRVRPACNRSCTHGCFRSCFCL